jgi:hypothetical protein
VVALAALGWFLVIAPVLACAPWSALMWASIATAVVGWIAKGLALFGVYLGGEKAQQAKDQQKVIEAAIARTQTDIANGKLSDADVLAKLRAEQR